jgi:hypothetical protein
LKRETGRHRCAFWGQRSQGFGQPGINVCVLNRPLRHPIKTNPRQKPEGFRAEIARERGFETIHLLQEMVAEFEYQPLACKKSYRMIVVRKRVGIDKGQLRLLEEYRYFFYIANDRTITAQEIVFSANDRCDQENLIAKLKGGVRALTAPVDDLVSNWAYMMMASRNSSRYGTFKVAFQSGC